MDHSLLTENVIVTASGIPHRVNGESFTMTFPNKRYSVKADNSLGEPIYTERPDWKIFTMTLNIPKASVSNSFLRRAMGYTVSLTWKDSSGTKLIHANACKINFDETAAEVDPTTNTWEIIGKANIIEPGNNSDLLNLVNLPAKLPDIT